MTKNSPQILKFNTMIGQQTMADCIFYLSYYMQPVAE